MKFKFNTRDFNILQRLGHDKPVVQAFFKHSIELLISSVQKQETEGLLFYAEALRNNFLVAQNVNKSLELFEHIKRHSRHLHASLVMLVYTDGGLPAYLGLPVFQFSFPGKFERTSEIKSLELDVLFYLAEVYTQNAAYRDLERAEELLHRYRRKARKSPRSLRDEMSPPTLSSSSSDASNSPSTVLFLLKSQSAHTSSSVLKSEDELSPLMKSNLTNT